MTRTHHSPRKPGSCRAEETIDIFEASDATWWQGRLNGRTGLVPSNYVERA
jgi:hypothetical protein